MTTHVATSVSRPRPPLVVFLLVAAMILVALAATLRTHDGPPTILLAPGSVQHTVVKPSATPDVLTTTT